MSEAMSDEYEYIRGLIERNYDRTGKHILYFGDQGLLYVNDLLNSIPKLLAERDAMKRGVDAAKAYCEETDKLLISPLYKKLESALSSLQAGE